jgi:transposase
MSKRIELQELSQEERQEIERLAGSRTESARIVQRAGLIQALADNPEVGAGQAGRMAEYWQDFSGTHWVRRFNQYRVAGLQDRARPGRPPTHDEAVRSAVIALAVQKPDTLGYPFKLWTLERLQQALEEREGIHLSDSTIWEWLAAEGLQWKRQQSWFHEAKRHDPEFAEKRGR